MAKIGKVSAVFSASTSGLTSGVNQARRSLSGLESGVTSLNGSMRALVAIQAGQLFGSIVSGAAAAGRAVMSLGKSAFSGISQAVGEATTLGEEISKSGVIFGQSAAQVAEFAKSASAIGLSESAALQATGSFGNLFTAMGLGRNQAAEYATTLTALGADLASFNNATVEEAVQAVGAALRGEAEPIRRFGVLLDEATLKQEALSAGLITSTKGSLTPAIKAQAAYAAILKQTAAAQGDFERTSGSLANLGRVVQAQTTNIFGDIGQAFEPLFQSATSAISQVLSAVRPFIQEVAGGVRSSIEVIGQALQNLVPQFTAFVGTFDGGSVGERIGQGILTGAEYLAGIADFIIAQVPKVFEFVSAVGGQWNAVWTVADRVGQFLYGVAELFRGVFMFVVSSVTAVAGRLVSAAGEIASAIPGWGRTGAQLEAAGASLRNSAQGFSDTATQAFANSGEALMNAIAGRSEEAGEAIAGPVTSALDQAIASAQSAAGQVSTAAANTVEQISGATLNVAQTVEVQGIKEAVQGIESNSAEGIREMFRIMRGGGQDVEQEQLGVLQQIAANTADLGGGLDLEVAELAPAAGG
jgi:hypothetical protein